MLLGKQKMKTKKYSCLKDKFPIGIHKIQHRPLKRIFDIVFSLFVLIFFFPVFLIIAFAIRFSSPGAIIYSHQRIGRGGKRFRCYKFRTMHVNADKQLKKLFIENPLLKKEWDRTQKLKNDPRIAPIGVFLRKTSLDELPQFLNVLIGDLSVVGPRAMVVSEINRFLGDKAKKILSVRPGITGLWQTSGRSDTSYTQRIKLDETYINNYSLILDLRLIAKTIPTMLSSKGAY